jgi:hypothetical protein
LVATGLWAAFAGAVSGALIGLGMFYLCKSESIFMMLKNIDNKARLDAAKQK